jgi:hypothetical protein
VVDGGVFMDDAGAIDAGPAPDAGDSDAGAAMVDSGTPSDAGSMTGPAVPGYPQPGDPNLHCAYDGKSFYYTMCDSTPTPVQQQPTGLCGGNVTAVSDVAPCAAQEIQMPTPEPSNWPCPLK